MISLMEEKKNAEPSAERQLTDKELEELLKKSENVTEFPEVTFDEFTPPTHEEWVDACNALLKGQPFDKVMFTKTYEGITFQRCIHGKIQTEFCRRTIIRAWVIS